MTKHHEEIENSTWFFLLGDKVLLLAIIAFFTPAVWALQLFHSGQVFVGSFAFVAWSGFDVWALWELHRRNYLRWRVSIPCTVLGLAAAILAVWNN
ncbi:MAG: hypothetical protein KIS62_04610 [Ramlibacter sp.]|nr:hypothetical protein [Ramlibacter sp.]